MLPHRMLGQWLWWNDKEWLDDTEISVIEGWERPEDLPARLRLMSPNGQQSGEGIYLLQEEYANGQPLWRKDTGDLWIYSMQSGKWGVGTSVEHITELPLMVLIYNDNLHNGVLPQDLSVPWARRRLSELR